MTYQGVSKSFRTESITEKNNKHSLRSNTKGYGGKTHKTDSLNSGTTAPRGRELYHLQFWLQAASPETFGYNLVCTLLTNEYYVLLFSLLLLLLRHFPYAFFRRRIFFFLLMDPLDIW
jgi:hypothetical protein